MSNEAKKVYPKYVAVAVTQDQKKWLVNKSKAMGISMASVVKILIDAEIKQEVVNDG